MRSCFKSILIFLCAALLVVTCVFSLAACNKNKGEDDAQMRAKAVGVVEDAFISNMGKGWSAELTNAQIAQLSDAGEFVIARGWINMLADVLESSSLQTAKLQRFANQLNSEDGKKLLSDFAKNAQLLIPLLKNVGFTSGDISGLVYGLLQSVVNETEDVLRGVLSDINTIRDNENLSEKARDSINVGLANVNSSLTLVPTSVEKQSMLASFDESHSAMNELVEFAYNMSITSMTDNIFDGLSTGALTDISDGEIEVYINSIMMSVGELKNALSTSELKKLNASLDLIIMHFDSAVSSSVLFSQIVKYAKFAYLFVDIIPTVCDFVTAFGGELDSSFITLIRSMSTVEESTELMKALNGGIIYAKALKGILEKYQAQELKNIISQFAQANAQDYQKALPVFYLDFALNIMFCTTHDISSVHKQIISDDQLAAFAVMAIFEGWLDEFKQMYYNYRNGTATLDNLVAHAGRMSASYLGTNPYNAKDKTADWYNWYVTQLPIKLQTDVSAYMTSVIADINAFIDDIYAIKTEIGEYAQMTFIESASDVHYERARDLMRLTGAAGLSTIGGLFGFGT